MGTPVPALPLESSRLLSLAERLAGVFFSPRETFADVARRPNFWVPLVLSMVSSLALVEAMLLKIGSEGIIRNLVEQSGRSSGMSADQLQQATERGAAVWTITGPVLGALGPLLVLLMVAGVGLLIVNGVFGAQTNFKTAFAVTCYAYLVKVLASLTALPVIFLGDPGRFNVTHPTPTNLGFFLDPFETSKPLQALATSVDIFTVWFLGLLGPAFSQATNGRVRALAIFFVFLALWAIVVLAGVGFAMLS